MERAKPRRYLQKKVEVELVEKVGDED